MKLVPAWGRRSMLAGCPLLNCTVSRSYPGCVPVRRSLMYATAGAWLDVIGADEAQVNAGRLVSGVGEALGLGFGLVCGEALGLGLELAPGTTVLWRFSGFATTRTPIK